MIEQYPTGVVTIVYADVESSTREAQAHGDAYDLSLANVHSIARETASIHGGVYALNLGDGFVLVFESPANAMLCACALQEATLGPEWKSELPRVKLRIGVHTDTPKLVDGFY